MAPSAIAEVLINKETRPQVASPAPRLVLPPRSTVERGPARGKTFFEEALLERRRFKSSSKMSDFLVALLFHVAVIGGAILAGLYYTDTINLNAFATTLLVAPPPPPPPPAPAAGIVKAQAPKRVFMTGGKLVAPTVIPRQIAEIKEAPLEPDGLGGVVGGVHPDYPPLARQARVQGQVQIDAVLDEQGNVIGMKVVSGPPLLYQAALDALKTWKYEPTYLNDQPIAVEMIVKITFQLGQ